MRDLIDLLAFQRQYSGQELALCTLIGKTGSAYRIPGARKIVARDQTLGACGLLSGGCLEPDIENAVREGWEKMSFIRSFSTMNPEDKLLGYQTGCAGVIEVLCEQLPTNGDLSLYIPFGEQPKAEGVLVSRDPQKPGQRQWGTVAQAQAANLFFDPWIKPLQLAVIGCGIDAAPFVAFAALLGWQVSFYDYRESLRGNLPDDADVNIMPLDHIAAALPEGDQVAIMLMTHNYQADLKILGELAGRTFGYVGCLGPRGRYEQLRAELSRPMSAEWERIIHAPAGIDMHSHTPVDIALSVTAQIQSLLA